MAIIQFVVCLSVCLRARARAVVEKVDSSPVIHTTAVEHGPIQMSRASEGIAFDIDTFKI